MNEDSDDKYEKTISEAAENSHDGKESGSTAGNNDEGKESGSEAENSGDGEEPENEAESIADNEYFLENAVLKDYEITINSITLKNPAEILEKMFPLKDDETLTNEEKSQQIKNIILEYMEW